MIKSSEILSHARAVVAKGWCQFRSSDGHGNCCIVGAMARAEIWATLEDSCCCFMTKPYEALDKSLREFGRYHDVVHFNDSRDTTQQDVLNLFDKAILELQERGE